MLFPMPSRLPLTGRGMAWAPSYALAPTGPATPRMTAAGQHVRGGHDPGMDRRNVGHGSTLVRWKTVATELTLLLVRFSPRGSSVRSTALLPTRGLGP